MKRRSSLQTGGSALPSTNQLEHDLLLGCARTILREQQLERINALTKQPVNWEYVIQTAMQHGVLPLLYQNLNAACREVIPDAVFSQLETRFRKNAISNLLSTAEMCRIVKLFKAQKIEVIPFKGPTLAIAAYGDLALRQFHDIDFIIRKSEVVQAKEVLLAEKYISQVECSTSTLDKNHEFPFKGAVFLELQTEMLHRKFAFAINDDELWQNLIELDIDGTLIRTLSPENLLMILCAHGTQSLWKRLIWICDIAEVVRACRLNWTAIHQRAKRLGAERMIRLGLCLANQLLGAPLPEALLEEIEADKTVAKLAKQITENLFYTSANFYQEMEQGWFYIKSRERLRDQALCFWRMATTPTELDQQLVKLPPPLAFLYYGIRPFRLIGKRGWRQLKQLFH